jgi:hypothetical protein
VLAPPAFFLRRTRQTSSWQGRIKGEVLLGYCKCSSLWKREVRRDLKRNNAAIFENLHGDPERIWVYVIPLNLPLPLFSKEG